MENNGPCKCPSCELAELKREIKELRTRLFLARKYVISGSLMGPWKTEEVLRILAKLESTENGTFPV
jgi:hypothetical protein